MSQNYAYKMLPIIIFWICPPLPTPANQGTQILILEPCKMVDCQKDINLALSVGFDVKPLIITKMFISQLTFCSSGLYTHKYYAFR